VMLAIGRDASASRAASVRPSTALCTTKARACTGGADACTGPQRASAAIATAGRPQRFTQWQRSGRGHQPAAAHTAPWSRAASAAAAARQSSAGASR